MISTITFGRLAGYVAVVRFKRLGYFRTFTAAARAVIKKCRRRRRVAAP